MGWWVTYCVWAALLDLGPMVLQGVPGMHLLNAPAAVNGRNVAWTPSGRAGLGRGDGQQGREHAGWLRLVLAAAPKGRL